MKKIVAAAALVGALAIPGVALAAPSFAGKDGCTGTDCYVNNPGRLSVPSHAQNNSGAASGAFGAFTGPGLNQAGGANGPATGCSNSGVAGNNSSGHC